MAIAVIMATASAKAQHEESEATIQPRIGMTMSTLTNMDDSKQKLNLCYGVEYEYYLTDRFSMALGVMFTNQGAKFKEETSSGTEKYELNVYYSNVPITANYYILPGLSVRAGLQPGYRVKTRMEINDEKIDMDKFLAYVFEGEDDGIKLNKFDLSIPVGLSLELYNVTLQASYNFGVTKLFSGISDTVNNRVLMVTLGYKL